MRALMASLALMLSVCLPFLAESAFAQSNVVPATQVITFHPAGATGAAVKGNCWTESIALQRADAWRCMVGNAIFDPCFSATPHAMSVICAAYPTHPVDMRVILAAPLPAHSAIHSTRPWSFVLGDGSYCVAFTGTIGLYHGLPMDYGCSNRWNVIGDPSAQSKIWYATVVTLNAQYQPVNVFVISVKALYH
ncbi:MAG TPA: hypothetical protein VHB98_07040 [Chloroflexota bacterium]|nr:hypothetical protein [Chloroflexota bacterium]